MGAQTPSRVDPRGLCRAGRDTSPVVFRSTQLPGSSLLLSGSHLLSDAPPSQGGLESPTARLPLGVAHWSEWGGGRGSLSAPCPSTCFLSFRDSPPE